MNAKKYCNIEGKKSKMLYYNSKKRIKRDSVVIRCVVKLD